MVKNKLWIELKEDLTYLSIFLLGLGLMFYYGYSGYWFFKMILHDNYEPSFAPIVFLSLICIYIVLWLVILLPKETEKSIKEKLSKELQVRFI